MPRLKLGTKLLFAAGIAIFLVLAVLLSGTVKVFHIPSSSMSPTIMSGDGILAVRVFRRGDAVRHGRLVIFTPPRSASPDGSHFLQRVVATGGDLIEVQNGRLRVNGKELPQRAGLSPGPAAIPSPRFPTIRYPLRVPEGEVFTLGDNHANSLDSRYFGSFPARSITYTAERIISPAGRAGKLH